MDHETVRVDLRARSYPIYIGAGLLDESGLLDAHIAGRQVLIVSDGGAGPLYADRVAAALPDRDVDVLRLPRGEHEKRSTT